MRRRSPRGHPRLPHRHRGPFGRTGVCPNSPAMPWCPRNRCPPSTSPAPMPLPTSSVTTVSRPRAAPLRCSARAARLAELSTCTGLSIRRASDWPSATPSQPRRIPPRAVIPVRASIGAATARPTASTSSIDDSIDSTMSSTSSAVLSSSASARWSRARGMCRSARTAPFRSDSASRRCRGETCTPATSPRPCGRVTRSARRPLEVLGVACRAPVATSSLTMFETVAGRVRSPRRARPASARRAASPR